MFDLLGSVRGLLRVDDVVVDNYTFKLHYRLSTVLLVTLSLIVTARQYIGDPIDCIMEGMPPGVADTYCWITTTYTLPSLADGRVGTDVVQPGVGAADYDGSDDQPQEPRYHKYYQWVCFVLFFQAASFYASRLAWKLWESGHVRALSGQLRGLMDDRTRADRVRRVAEFFARDRDVGELGPYAVRFFACELLNLANVLGQLWLLDMFLDGEFRSYGLETLRFGMCDREGRSDPMARVFPKVTMCTFRKYGPSGSVQKLEGLCVLPVNVVNEKIFVFLWFWMWVVAAVSAFSVAYRAVALASPAVRSLLLRARLGMPGDGRVQRVLRATPGTGAWFLLYQLAKNVESYVFKELIAELAEMLSPENQVRLAPPEAYE